MKNWVLLILSSLWLQIGGFAKESSRPTTSAPATNTVPAVHSATPDTGVLPSKFTDPKTLAPEESSGEIARLAARMIEQGHDVLYYENIEGGHGGAANNAQRANLVALENTFLWLSLGGK